MTRETEVEHHLWYADASWSRPFKFLPDLSQEVFNTSRKPFSSPPDILAPETIVILDGRWNYDGENN